MEYNKNILDNDRDDNMIMIKIMIKMIKIMIKMITVYSK